MSKSRREEYRRLATWVGNIFGTVMLVTGMFGVVLLIKRGDEELLANVVGALIVFSLGGMFGKYATLGGLFDDDAE